MTTKGSLLCYNRGCGQRFNAEENADGMGLPYFCGTYCLKFKILYVYSKNNVFITYFYLLELVDACLHHPGAPFFHDAYKGWSCCKKKCTDFTEFLNIKVIPN